MKLEHLLEKRSNPDLNVKTTPLNELKSLYDKYGNKIYVSFTQGQGPKSQPKLGVNPKSNFSTPLGVYFYPVETVLEYSKNALSHVTNYGDLSGGLEAPFTGNTPWDYAWVVRLDDANILRDNLSVGVYADAIDKLHEIWPEKYGDFVNFVTKSEEEAYNPSRVARLWKITENFSKLSTSHMKKFGKSTNIGAWNKLMRYLGYDAAYDDGAGWIHENEPEQIVVFNVSVIKPVRIISRYTGDEKLFYGMIEKAKKNPDLIKTIPPEVASRLTTNVAHTILDNYVAMGGGYGLVSPDAAITKFMQALSSDVLRNISPALANAYGDIALAVVGWENTVKFHEYHRIKRMGYYNLAYYSRVMIDNQLAERVVQQFYADYEAGSDKLAQEYSLMPDAVYMLSQVSYRFENYEKFKKLMNRGIPLTDKYQKALDAVLS